MSDSPIRIAIVGVGKIARDRHIPALRADPRFALVATASRDGAIDGLPAYRDVADLIAAGHDLAAVSVCTPPLGRAAIVARAVDAGLAVMMEKPPAATLSEVAMIAAHAARARCTVFAAWHSRETAAVERARDWLAGRRIDRVTIDWREDIRRWHPGQDWVLAAGGFGVFDPGINALSILTAILPEPPIVERATIDVPAGRDSPIAAALSLRTGAAPIAARFDFLHEGAQQWDIVVETDRGAVRLSDGGRVIEADGTRFEAPDEEYPRLYDRFASLVGTGESDIDPAPLRLVADAFLLAERRSVAAFDW